MPTRHGDGIGQLRRTCFNYQDEKESDDFPKIAILTNGLKWVVFKNTGTNDFFDKGENKLATKLTITETSKGISKKISHVTRHVTDEMYETYNILNHGEFGYEGLKKAIIQKENEPLIEEEIKDNTTIDSPLNSDQKESKLVETLFKNLDGTINDGQNDELFHFVKEISDECIDIKNKKIIFEIKKVKKGRKCDYWHAFIHSKLYFYQEKKKNIILCIVFDWDRATGSKLEQPERGFIDKFKEDNIYFVRVNMKGKQFIEHNINGKWKYI